MTLTESFNKWLARIDHAGLPWQTSKDELLDIFTAGFHAGVESTKQADLFPGTLSHGDTERRNRTHVATANELFPGTLSSEQAPYHASCPVKLTGPNCLPCSEDNAVRAGDRAPITAEDIYAAWPVKKARGAAILAIRKAMKKEAPDKLLAAVKELAACYAQWPVAEKQYLPMCSTFMNQERWADDRTTWRKGAAAAPSQFTRKYE